MSATTSTARSPQAGQLAAPVAAATGTVGRITNAVSQVIPDQARKVAVDLAQRGFEEAKATGKRAVEQGTNLLWDSAMQPIQTTLRTLSALPAGDTIIEMLGKALISLNPDPTKFIIPDNLLIKLRDTPEQVGADVKNLVATLWQQPNIQGIIKSLNPQELINKASEWLDGLANPKAPAQASPQPIAQATPQTSTTTTKKAETKKPSWYMRPFHWIGKLAGPSDPKEIEAALKKAGSIKTAWLKLPSSVRKIIFFGGGSIVGIMVAMSIIAKIVAFLPLLLAGGGAYALYNKFVPHQKPTAQPRETRSIFNPWRYIPFIGGKYKNSKKTEATAPRAAEEAAPANGKTNWMDTAKKVAGSLMSQGATGTHPAVAALGGLLGGGGAPANN